MIWDWIKKVGFKITIKANWQKNDDGTWWYEIKVFGFKVYEHGVKDG